MSIQANIVNHVKPRSSRCRFSLFFFFKRMNMPPWKLLFTLYLTTFTAGSTVHYLKAARRDKNFSTLHGEIVKNDLLMPTLFIASLWYCIYTLQYSAKKQNVQLHKYKIRPLCLMVKHIQRVTLKCCDEFSKTKQKCP